MKSQLPQHLFSIQSLNPEIIHHILERATYYLHKCVQKNSVMTRLKGKIVTHLFFEPSTRTHYSFEIAAKRLGAITLSPQLNFSSLLKGETFLDTIRAFIELGTQIFIIRYAENTLSHLIPASLLSQALFINAGDGTNEHPTQALIDLLTIQQHKSSWSSLRIAIVGDIAHSRVANSLVKAFSMMGVKEIRLIGPNHLLPPNPKKSTIALTTSLDEGLVDCDIVVCLRLQKERAQELQQMDMPAFHHHYGLTVEKLKLAKPDALVMHPGPINREVEISSAVADGQQSVILQQVRNAVALRMAILDLFSRTR